MTKNLIIVLGLLMGFAGAVQAQRIGIGAQFGDPTGLTLRINTNSAVNYDILASWDVDDYFFINFHGLWEHALPGVSQLHYFYGPGVFVGARDRGRWEDDDVYIGFSGSLGLNLYIQRLELFAQVTPRLSIVPRTDGGWGGGLGARFYLN